MSSRPRRQPVSSDRRFKKHKPHLDFGTAELWGHVTRTWTKTDQSAQPVARVVEESVLDVLVLLNVLDEKHGAAGLKFKADFHAASLSSHVTSSYNPNGVRRDHFFERERNDGEEAAYQRWRRALIALEPRYRNLVVTTICCDIPPPRADHAALHMACEQLVKWYGL